MEEIWKPIDWSEGRYHVSNMGRVRSSDWRCRFSDGTLRLKKGRILKPYILKCGYAQLQLQYKGKRKHFYVHRLIAEAFIDNPNNFKYINHIDENKLNNIVSNLEWCTFLYNINYGTRNKRAGMKVAKEKNPNYNKLGKDSSRAIPVAQYTKNGVFVKEYDCAATAMRETGINQSTIRQVVKGCKNRKTAGGYLWRNIQY